MRYRTYIIVPTVTYGLWRFAEFMLLNEECKMSFEQRCRKYGYDTERHFVTTDDGYILQIFRLVDKYKDSNNQSRPPVLLQHGLMDTCMGMVSNGEKSPAIYLAKQGFDVWIGNNRGNSYSRHHKTLIPDVDAKYNDYTFEDMGLYDTKAMIQHINNTTKIPKITYLGISQGGAQMYHALALNNEWFKNHLNLMIAVCSPVKRINPISKPSDEITPRNIISILCNSLRFSGYFSNFGKKLNCMMLRLYPEYGRTYGSDVLEGKPEINDVDSCQRVSFNFPDGTSQKNLNHWNQIVKSQQVRRYDYGEEGNLEKYGTKEPPIVDISQIRDVPIAIFAGKHDLIAPLRDLHWVRDNLDPSVLKHYEECEAGHLTFMIGKEVPYLDRVQQLIREYSK